MFGNVRIKPGSKTAPKKLPSNARFSYIRVFADRCYRNPYNWGLIKCIAFFAASIYTARFLIQLEILPADPTAQPTQVAY